MNIKEKTKKEPNLTISESKLQTLESLFSQIDKHYGKGSVMLLGQNSKIQVEVISTGSILIDQATGINGLPKGRIIEVFGPESSGKTTIALQTVAQAQKNGGICAFIDAEHALDASYASKLGIKINDLIVSQPDYGEQALDIAEMLIRSGAIDIIVIDSVAALVPKSELEGDMGDVHVGLQARLMSQALRKLAPIVHKSNTIIIFINQIRHNINSMPFANKETTTGGNALKFYASIRLDVRRIEGIKKDNAQVGNKVRIKVVKNKMAPPFRQAVVNVLFGEGVSKEHEIIDISLTLNLIQQSGSWFSYQGEKIAQGREQLVNILKTQEDITKKLEEQIQIALKEGKQIVPLEE